MKKKPVLPDSLVRGLPVGSAVTGINRVEVDPDFDITTVEKWGASPDFPEQGGGLKKKATHQVIPGGSDFGSDVNFYPPMWFSPLMSWVHFYMPRDIKTTYTWIRHWDTFNPLIGNAIDLHTQMPLSRFAIKVDDPYIREIYANMMDMLGGLLLLYDMVREYWLFGEMFAYLYWDNEVGLFTDIQLLPPEDIIIQGNYFAQNIYLNPESFNINPDSQIDKIILQKAPELARALQEREPIPLDPFFVVSMQRKQSAYMNRGQSIVLRAMKDLIYNDKLREAQYAIAQRHITPKEIWTIGNDMYPATEDQIAHLRSLVQRAGQSPLFTLFTNHTVRVEYVGANGKFIDFAHEYEQIEKNILTAMFTNKAITHGEGPTYANASVAMRVLMQRYMYVRGLLESVLLDNIFLPVAVAHEFFEITEAELSHHVRRPFSERKPILPEFDWKAKANLLDTTNMVSIASQLKQMGFSHKTVADLLGIDYEQDKFWREQEEGTVFDPLYDEWRKRVAEGVPAPVGQEKTSSFKLPVITGKNSNNEPVTEEVEFTWVSRGSLLTKKRLFDWYVKPYLNQYGAVPAKVVANLKPSRPGSPTLVDLEPITEEDLKELKRRFEE